jgi:hypothetical protein
MVRATSNPIVLKLSAKTAWVMPVALRYSSYLVDALLVVIYLAFTDSPLPNEALCLVMRSSIWRTYQSSMKLPRL